MELSFSKKIRELAIRESIFDPTLSLNMKIAMLSLNTTKIFTTHIQQNERWKECTRFEIISRGMRRKRRKSFSCDLAPTVTNNRIRKRTQRIALTCEKVLWHVSPPQKICNSLFRLSKGSPQRVAGK
mmetsp:Transcript_20920/g.43478  ORF Transcript_20920/g.43478 Transcript_20920/m.43478 type:complete len:127 (-) Transcript_20920:1830-2210(-)